MSYWNPYDESALKSQIERQEKETWSFEDVDWQQGIDLSKLLLPMDNDCIAFPNASPEQRLALSQFMGLVVNATIAEMEAIITKLQDVAWRKVLDKYPVNPEMWRLGELFFEEEEKHSRTFYNYNDLFCKEAGIDPDKMSILLPRVPGSLAERLIFNNAKNGGYAFWWVVSVVEEGSIQIYRNMHHHKNGLDPLYFEIHRRHLEDEARHRSYAFLMLDILRRRQGGLGNWIHRKADLLIAQSCVAGWTLSNCERIFDSKKIKNEHPFFETLATCCDLFDKKRLPQTLYKLFKDAPYISLLLNTRFHRQTVEMARSHSAFSLPLPAPKNKKVSALLCPSDSKIAG